MQVIRQHDPACIANGCRLRTVRTTSRNSSICLFSRSFPCRSSRFDGEVGAARMPGAAIVRHRESIDFRIARRYGLRVSRLFAVRCNKRSALHWQPAFGAISIAPYACLVNCVSRDQSEGIQTVVLKTGRPALFQSRTDGVGVTTQHRLAACHFA